MLGRLRQVLLRDFIGGFVIAWMLANGLGSLIGIFSTPLELLAASLFNHAVRDTLGAVPEGMRAGLVISGVVRASLFFLVAYILASWLYGQPKPQKDDTKGKIIDGAGEGNGSTSQ